MQEIPSRKEISERVKKLRTDHKLSQAAIAQKLNISRSNYSQIELGNQFPTFNTIHLMARYYGKSYDWILHGASSHTGEATSDDLQQVINELKHKLSDFVQTLKTLEAELSAVKEKIQQEA